MQTRAALLILDIISEGKLPADAMESQGPGNLCFHLERKTTTLTGRRFAYSSRNLLDG